MRKHVNQLIDSAVVSCLVMAVAILAASLFHLVTNPLVVSIHLAAISHFVQRFLAFALLLVVWNLHKRKFAAWLLAVLALTVSFVMYAVHRNIVGDIVMVLQAYCLVVLLTYHRRFRRPLRRPSVRRMLVLAVAVIVFLLANAVYGHMYLGRRGEGDATLGGSLHRVVEALFVTGGANPFSRFIVVFTWIAVGVLVVFILRPLVYHAITSPAELKRARELVKKYGQNPASYLELEADKTLYFSSQVEGVLAYGIVDNCVVVHCDPVCAPEHFLIFLAEFDGWCRENDYRYLFLSTTDVFLPEYEKLGFEHVKCGEEARIRLAEYTLKGGRFAKLRAEINHATKAGVVVGEYRPLDTRDPGIERAIAHVSDDWLAGKKSGRLVFAVGGVNLDNPLDRRYFYAAVDGKIVAFNVFLPFGAGEGYMTDVTRRTHDAPSGVSEKITYEAFQQFASEGCVWGSMGVSPLANVEDGDNANPTIAKVLELVYERGSRFYGFKSLHQVKERYAPTAWLPAYFVYSPKSITVDMAVAIIQLQNSSGLTDFFTSRFRRP
ncbi:MAG: DUF2156 domain-containing protein [Propionibacteriaceae bacterium]|jgi:phosphatidylglycerol lysyltransferase|nr:DUF2156 domain-containing protein [Propionibacteriaceae bacterium]